MFDGIIEKNSRFTFPVVISKVNIKGDVDAKPATYFVINDDGWCVTCRHITDLLDKYESDKKRISDYVKESAKIAMDIRVPPTIKQVQIASIKPNNAIKKLECWWGHDDIKLLKKINNNFGDLSLVQLSNIDKLNIENYPVLRDTELKRYIHNENMCLLGYPNNGSNMQINYAPNTDRFINKFNELKRYDKEVSFICCEDMPYLDKNNKVSNIMIQPGGRKGFSGGPIFDTEGEICGVTSQGMKDPDSGETIYGYGVNVKVIIEMLRNEGIKYNEEKK